MGGRGDTSPIVSVRDREQEQERDRGPRDRGDRIGRGERAHVDRGVRTDRVERTEASERGDKEDQRTNRGQRAERGEREWTEGPGRGTQNGSAPLPSLGSLRDRISNAPGNFAPSGSSSVRAGSEGNTGRDEHGDRLKRSATDREREILHAAIMTTNALPPSSKTSSKRVRIDRSRISGDAGSGSSRRTVRQ